MKKSIYLILSISLFLLTGKLSAQSRSCCSAKAPDAFAMLGNDATFQTAHISPEPINFTPSKGEMVTYKTTGGKDANAFFVRAENKSDKFLFVFHEWWGLNDYIKQQAERFATDFPGVNVLALDLYDGKLATNAEDATAIMESIKTERAEAIINGAINYIGTTASVQTIGWCFGGTWSMQAAIMLGKQAKGCVIYYGMPELDPKRIEMLRAPVQGIFALNDVWITKPIVEEFELQMKELNKPVSVTWFDAVHAFANPSNPQHDEAATTKARAITDGFLKGNFEK